MTTFPKNPPHNDILGMSQNTTKQKIISKHMLAHTHTHTKSVSKMLHSIITQNFCYIKLSEALGKRAIVTKINPAADLSYNIISNSSRIIYKSIP